MKSFEVGRKKTIVFYLHGLRGHAYAQIGALRHLAKNLGVTVVTLELPGHGKDSTKEHCMVPDTAELVEMILDEVRARAADTEQIILMGYSFGAALMTVVAHRLEQERRHRPKVAGLVGISTAFDVGHNVPRWQLWLVNIIAPLSHFLYHRLPTLSRWITIGEMDVVKISPDKHVQEAILKDKRLYKGRIPLHTSAQVYKAGLEAKRVINDVRAPVLLLHSADDSIALPPSEEDCGENITLKMFTNLRHNCIDGVLREAVRARQFIARFIASKL